MNVLALDCGTQSLRGIVFDEYGSRVSSFYRHSLQTNRNQDVSKQSPLEWIAAVESIMQEISIQVPLQEIDAITYTATNPGFILVDEHFFPLTDCFMYDDKRRPREFDMSRQSLAHSNTKLSWVKENDPAALEKASFVTDPLSFMIHYFTGQFLRDRYSDELTKVESTSVSNPQVVEIPIALGLGDDIKQKHGLNRDALFCLSSYDGICARIGMGLIKERDCGLTLGTNMDVSIISATPWNSFRVREFFEGTYLVSVTLDGLGLIVEDAVKRCHSYEHLFLEIAQISETTPYMPPQRDIRNRDGYFIGKEPESLLSRFKSQLDGYIDAVGEVIQRSDAQHIIACGGLSQNPEAMRYFSKKLDMPLLRPREQEATVLGSAILSSVALGQYSSLSEAIGKMVKIG